MASESKFDLQGLLRAVAVATDSKGNNTRFIQQQVSNEQRKSELDSRREQDLEDQERRRSQDLEDRESDRENSRVTERNKILTKGLVAVLQNPESTPEDKAIASKRLKEIDPDFNAEGLGPSVQDSVLADRNAREQTESENKLDPNSTANVIAKRKLGQTDAQIAQENERIKIAQGNQEINAFGAETQRINAETNRLNAGGKIKTPTKSEIGVVSEALSSDEAFVDLSESAQTGFSFYAATLAQKIARAEGISMAEALPKANASLKGAIKSKFFGGDEFDTEKAAAIVSGATPPQIGEVRSLEGVEYIFTDKGWEPK